MIEERCLSTSDEREWRAAVAALPHAFAHTVECCRAFHLTTGWTTYLYSLTLPDGARVVYPFAERRFEGSLDFVTPYQFSGPVGTASPAVFRDSWKHFARRRGAVCNYAALHPALATAVFFDQSESSSANDLYLLDLTLPVDSLLAQFDRSRQRALRDYAKTSKTLVRDRGRLLAFLLDTYPAFLARIRASRANDFTPETLTALAELENVEWIGAAPNGRIEAVYLFGFTPHVADCLLNVAIDRGREHTTLLLWAGILALQEKGIPLLNLGGGATRDDAIAKAKQRFRARRVPMTTVRQIFDRAAYDRLCRSAGVDPAENTGYFPAYYRALVDR